LASGYARTTKDFGNSWQDYTDDSIRHITSVVDDCYETRGSTSCTADRSLQRCCTAGCRGGFERVDLETGELITRKGQTVEVTQADGSVVRRIYTQGARQVFRCDRDMKKMIPVTGLATGRQYRGPGYLTQSGEMAMTMRCRPRSCLDISRAGQPLAFEFPGFFSTG
jgi:hypothetical protein